jgi:hypothetical protein
MDKLIAGARERGLARIYRGMLAGNRSVLGTMKKLSFQLTRHPEDGTLVPATREL